MISTPSQSVNLVGGLTLDGTCQFSVSSNRVLLGIDAIRNHRDIGNLSGSLAVELWAMKQPLNCTEPESEDGAQRLAATTIGEIRGQHFVPDCRYDLLFDQPAPGSWQIALLLREWNGHGYSTCDAVNFPVPYQVNTPLESTAKAPIISSASEVTNTPQKAGKTEKATEATAAMVPVNSASLDEIAAIKGVSHKLAKAIVAGRPYKDFKDLLAVKGVGERLLRTLRQLISLT